MPVAARNTLFILSDEHTRDGKHRQRQRRLADALGREHGGHDAGDEQAEQEQDAPQRVAALR